MIESAETLPTILGEIKPHRLNQERDRAYYLANKARKLETNRAWKARNREKDRAWTRNAPSNRKRRHNQPPRPTPAQWIEMQWGAILERDRPIVARIMVAMITRLAMTPMERYYANHEESKRVGRENAKRVWEKNKSNPEWIAKKREMAKLWKLKNPEWRKAYYQKNAEKCRASIKAWELKNPEKAKAIRKATRKRQDAKPENRITRNLRQRMRDFVRSRSDIPKDLIGCSPLHLRTHIEAQWKRGMRWENYGKTWVIDHIIPCASFDLTDKQQARQCFNWLNLRPLGKQANEDKSDTITEPQQHLMLTF